MTAGAIEDIYKLSPIQHGILVHYLAQPDAGLYFEQFSWMLDQAPDLAAFRRAWTLVQAQHPVLRTAFFWAEIDEPLQVVRRSAPLPLRLLDLRALTPDRRARAIPALLAADRRAGFDLSDPPLMRLLVIRRAEDDYQFLWSYHHLLLDGWSVGLLMQDVFSAYALLRQGQAATLPARRPYRDYIAWLRRQDLAAAEAFWRSQLADVTEPTRLRIAWRAGPADAAQEPYAERERLLSDGLSAALQALARRHRVTFTTLLEAAWALLLRSYSGDSAVTFGLTVAGRPPDLPGSEAMIGLFINTLPVRVRMSPARALPAWLAELHAQQMELRQYEHSPLVEVQGWSGAPRGTPLFETILVVENYRLTSRTRELYVSQRTNYPLALVVEPGAQVRMRIGYATERFAGAAVEQMLGHLVTLLAAMVAQPEARIGALGLLTAGEQAALIECWRGAPAASPAAAVHERVAAQARARPDAVALTFAEPTRDERRMTNNEGSDSSFVAGPASRVTHLTYGALNARANQLAHWLQRMGVGPEARVAVRIDRGPGLVVALLGVLKAGGSYVPLDPRYPAERIRFTLEDSQARILICDLRFAIDDLEQSGATIHNPQSTIVQLGADWPAIAALPDDDPQVALVPDNLAYVIYTSGSTGSPKGVMATHANLARLLAATQPWFDFGPQDVWTLFHSAAFDFSVWELWGALCYGGRLVVAPYLVSRDPAAFAALLRDERVTVLNQTPSAFRQLVQAVEQSGRAADPSLRLVIFGGEALDFAILKPWFARHGDARPQLVNMYGITETTVHVTYRPLRAVDATDDGGSAIGRPIPDLQLYLLDDQMRPAPIGVAGEIHVGGAGVTRGYLGRPDLTAERFIPNPFAQGSGVWGLGSAPEPRSPIPDPRLYRTGDLACFTHDGELVYFGRADQQAKIRGFRIEPGEVEAALRAHPAVRDAVALVRDGRLIAYVAPGDEFGVTSDSDASLAARHSSLATELRDWLAARLPDHMIPAAFVPIRALPLTPNGKLDRSALPAPAADSLARADFVAPRTPHEDLLASIFAAVLGLREVGVHDNFFVLGGHSLLATQVISRARRAFGVELPLRTLFERPTAAELAERIAALQRDGQVAPPPIRPVERSGAPPLSFAQQRLWFLDRMDPGGSAYNIPVAVRMRGALDAGALRWSMGRIVRRHEALRTTFADVDGQPVQRISPAARLPLPLLDLRGLPDDERAGAALGLARVAATRPFDLAHGPLLRAALLRIDDDDHLLALTMHHIVSDGWSMGVLVRELAELYAARHSARPAGLPDLPIQYADYAAWQRAWLQGDALAAQLAYWRAQLADLAQLDLPTDRPRPQATLFPAAYHPFTIAGPLADDLAALAQREGITLFMALLAAFQILLARYSGQGDICVGTPIANRTRSETEGLLGFFVNTLALRADLSDDPPARAALERAREVCLGAYAHQDLPFEQVVEALHPARDLGRHPLFQVMFMLQNAPQDPLELPGLSLHPLALPAGDAKFDLSLSLGEDAGALAGTLEYRADLFDASTIQRMAGHYQALLAAIVAQPDQRASELPLLGSAERQQILIEWNDTDGGVSSQQSGARSQRAELGRDNCIHQLFEAQATRTPDAVALAFEGEGPGSGTERSERTKDDGADSSAALQAAPMQLTYAALDARANQLARYLRGLGARPEDVVGVCVERSLEMVVALLAVLKAGCAYLPLDPGAPAERIRFMLEDSRARILITGVGGGLGEGFALSQALSPYTDWPQIAQLPATPPDSGATLANLAYVIYTSGSTGRPKGVLGSHGSALNRFRWMWARLPFAPGEVGCQKTALSFVDSIWELFGPLLQGVRVALIPEDIVKDPARLMRSIAAQRVTRIVLAPTLLRAILDTLDDPRNRPPALRYWISSGEALPADLLRRFRALLPRSALLNLYGSSEAAADATWFDTRALQDDAIVPIGRPIANLRIYLLDRRGRPTPIGVAGEIHVGGAGLARGYLGRPDLTAERFIPNPFAPAGSMQSPAGKAPTIDDRRLLAADCRLYKTGDLARFRPDGAIEYLGRRDHQVKIRGVRVELGEVEAALLLHPLVQECAAVFWASAPGGPRLVGYVVTSDELTGTSSGEASLAAELRAFLRSRLPEAMIPALFAPLFALPITPSGKLDRRALPDPADLLLTPGEILAADSPAYVAPRTPTEQVIAAIWAEVLDRPLVGVEDNFFEQGGHSLLAMRVIARVGRAFGVDLLVRRLFEAPTVAGLARVVDVALRAAPAGQRPLHRVPRGAPLPLSFAQQRLWFLDRLDPDSAAYHMPIALRLDGPLDAAILRRGLGALVQRHEALRTTFAVVDGQPAQIVRPSAPAPLRLIDLRAIPAGARAEAMRGLIGAEIHRPFDLARGPLIRAALLRIEQDAHVILLTTHHIVSDGWSQGILLNELAILCGAIASHRPSGLPDLPIQYADFAAWQRAQIQGELLEDQLRYWKRRLAGLAPLDLPLDRPRPALQTFRGARAPIVIPAPLAASLRALSQSADATLFMTLLMAFQALLARYSGRADIAVGSPIAGRNHVEVEGVVGLFANTLVLRTDLSGDPTARELLGRVREAALGAYSHQDAPFEQLVEALQPERDLSHNPLFQALFGLQNATPPPAAFVGLTARPLDFDLQIARFDLSLDLWDGPQSIAGRLEYNTDLFDETTILRMSGHLLGLLAEIAADPQQGVWALPILSRQERQQILVEWNDTASVGGRGPEARSQDVRLHALFASQAARTPDAVALVYEGARLTYAALNARANQLAHFLRARGAGPESLVGVSVERSIELVVAILGVLKAGSAYVPLDPAYPPERIRLMLEDSQAATIVTKDERRTTKAERAPTQDEGADLSLVTRHLSQLDLSADWPAIAALPAGNPRAAGGPAGLAYVIYTSGSTGQPKGVMVGHRGVANLIAAARPLLKYGADDVWTIVHSYTFDFSVWELWGPLLCGGCLVVAPLPTTQAPAALRDLLARERVTTLNQTPTALRPLLEALGERKSPGGPRLRRIVCGGEAFAPDLIGPALACGAPVWNFYGPTEATVWAATKLLRPGERAAEALAIGRPLANAALYVLDARMRPVPIGVAGELCIGGVQLARGYLRRPDLTAERFLPNPFAGIEDRRSKIEDSDADTTKTLSSIRYPRSSAGARLYRTGDLARYLPSGNLEFLGRIDGQIKLRGYRIELGEIEAALAARPDVREAAVVVRADAPGDPRLVAYVVTSDELHVTSVSDSALGTHHSSLGADLRTFLAARLPAYMIPAAFVALGALPRTPNGKLDRQALPPPNEPAAPEDAAALRTPTEELVAGIWASLLGRAQIGPHENFFALGGHSLLAVQALARIQAALGVDLPVRSIFDAPTVAGLAAGIDAAQPAADAPPLRAAERGPDLPLSPAQQRLWFLDQLDPGSPAYNLPVALRLRGPLDMSALTRSFVALARRHETLRTTFVARAGQPAQRIADDPPPPPPLLDLAGLPEAARATAARRISNDEAARPFDLARGPLVRAGLLRLAANDHLLLLTMHHIISDGWSMGVIVREVAALYAAARRGQPAGLPDLPIQYADYAIWQRQWMAGPARERQMDYWRRRLADLPALNLPTDRPRPAVASAVGARQQLRFGADLHAALRALCRQEDVTLFMALLTIFQAALAQWSGQDEIVVGTDVANRPQLALEGLIGFFVNQLALRTSLAGDPTFREALARTRATCLEAYAHQDAPFEQVVAAIQPERRLDRTPLFQVKLILQNAPPAALKSAELQVEPAPLDTQAAPFELALSLHETEAGILGSIDYRADLFERSTIRWLAQELESLAWAAARAPEQRLSALGRAAQERSTPEPEPEFAGARRRRLTEARRKAILDTDE